MPAFTSIALGAALVLSTGATAVQAREQKKAQKDAEQQARRQQRAAQAALQAEQTRAEQAKHKGQVEKSARARKRAQAARASGQRADVFTSPLGIVGGPPNVAKKELIGL